MAKQVLLIDIDGHNFPNLCLMKLSAYYKQKGDIVCLWKLTKEDRKTIRAGVTLLHYASAVYGACVFTENRDVAQMLGLEGVIIGGSGSGSQDTLSEEIEHIYPDYSLYDIKNTAYGFLTRGCPRQCPFCIVAQKEGRQSVKVADLKEFWHGQRYIKLLDPNLLACPEHMDLLRQLADSGAWVDFTQGLDARLTTEENLSLLKQIKIKALHFAWDNPRNTGIKEDFLRIRDALDLDYRRKIVYVLTNYWSSIEEDLERIYWLRDNGYSPFVMIYDKKNAPAEIRRLQRWVNNRQLFYSCRDFHDYV